MMSIRWKRQYCRDGFPESDCGSGAGYAHKPRTMVLVATRQPHRLSSIEHEVFRLPLWPRGVAPHLACRRDGQTSRGLRLLDDIALEGTQFPAALLMFRKASFTLEGVVEDVGGSRVRLDSLMARHALANWSDTVAGVFSLLSARDWMMLDWSTLTYTSHLCYWALLRPWDRPPGISANADSA